MADPKICVYSKSAVGDLHSLLRNALSKKIEEEDWSEAEKEEFKLELFKVYEETVELALRENVETEMGDASVTREVRQQMEPVNKERAIEVNKMCEESEDLLTCTIKKRKAYPQRVKDYLKKQYDAEMNSLCDLEKKESNESRIKDKISDESQDFNQTQLDMTDCENYMTRLKGDSESLLLLSKSLSETKTKAERLYTATKMHLKMQESDINKVLFSKRKLPMSFDSILATPTKDSTTVVSTESKNTVTSTWLDQHGPSKKLKGLERNNSPNRT